MRMRHYLIKGTHILTTSIANWTVDLFYEILNSALLNI